jgi:hypothetical protein
MGIDELVVSKSPEPSIKWIPDDYGFERHKSNSSLWYYKNFELRSLANDYWLLRRKVKNERGNSEMLVKWYFLIPLDDKELADMMFTKGLR